MENTENTALDVVALRRAANWGLQGGLLSEAELAGLHAAVVASKARRVLEVGHYCGLSTAVIHQALLDVHGLGGFDLWTIDHHRGDDCVPRQVEGESAEVICERNRSFYRRATVLHGDSRSITRLVRDANDPELVFYDGDHRAEQLRFVALVHDSPGVRTLVLDDLDFPAGRAATEFLLGFGWSLDRGPGFFRDPVNDKVARRTYTLGVFTREVR